MTQRIAIIFSFVLAALAATIAPTGADNTAQRPYVYSNLASFCEESGCTMQDFYPVIDQETGQIIEGIVLFLPLQGCANFLPQSEHEDITILSLIAEDVVVAHHISNENNMGIADVCQALVTFSGDEPGSLVASCKAAADCYAARLIESAIRMATPFIDEVPEGLIMTGWADGTLLIMQPGSITASPIEHYVLYQIPIVSE